MTNKNDWRLINQEKFLKDKTLKSADYKPYSEKWNHDHCAFCQAAFSLYDNDLQKGYCTLDNYHWICEECFNDFKEMFNWSVEK
jgi:hypothetical protein